MPYKCGVLRFVRIGEIRIEVWNSMKQKISLENLGYTDIFRDTHMHQILIRKDYVNTNV